MATIPSIDSPPKNAPSPLLARAMAAIVAVVVLAFLGLLIWSLGRRAEGTVGDARISIRPVPAVTLRLFDGGTTRFADLEGRPAIVNFWASWCVPCEDEAEALERASRKYGDRVQFVGVAVQDTESNAREFIRRFGVSFPNGLDASGEISVEFGMTGVPETYLVDRRGMLIRKWQGPVDDARLEQFVRELLD